MTASAETVSDAYASEKKVPEFFIVGNPKSGTTALYEMLRAHPQIYMPKLGTQFFALEQVQNPATLNEYLSLFDTARPGQRVGEMSRGYFRSPTAASAIAELRPDARIIAVLREPASFLRSLHMELVQDRVETEPDLAKAIALEERTRQGQEIRQSPSQGLKYSAQRVSYVEQLRRYHAVFPREQVLVLIYDDFRADNEGTVRQVLRFLDVDDSAPIETTDANPTVRVRSPRLHELVHSLAIGRGPVTAAVKQAIKTLTPQRLRHDGLRALRRSVLYAKPEPPDEQLMLELRRRSKGEVVALSEYLGRDLVTLWGYDSLG
jgi:Sulfotransferase domain